MCIILQFSSIFCILTHLQQWLYNHTYVFYNQLRTVGGLIHYKDRIFLNTQLNFTLHSAISFIAIAKTETILSKNSEITNFK